MPRAVMWEDISARQRVPLLMGVGGLTLEGFTGSVQGRSSGAAGRGWLNLVHRWFWAAQEAWSSPSAPWKSMEWGGLLTGL